MVTLKLTKEQFKEFQHSLETAQTKTPDANVQVFIESNSKTASGGFGFESNPSVFRSLD
jgi:hypothetical protein